MSEPALVLDTAAVLAFARGTDYVGEILASIADEGDHVLIPATCLASAYAQASSVIVDYLGLLASLPHTIVTPLTEQQCAVTGSWARYLGLDVAHAAVEAGLHPVTPLMTSQREAVTRFLPKAWPIIDIP